MNSNTPTPETDAEIKRLEERKYALMGVNDSFLFGLATGLFVMLAIILFTNAKTEAHWQEQAIKAGKAEYYLDENNNKQWRWK